MGRLVGVACAATFVCLFTGCGDDGGGGGGGGTVYAINQTCPAGTTVMCQCANGVGSHPCADGVVRGCNCPMGGGGAQQGAGGFASGGQQGSGGFGSGGTQQGGGGMMQTADNSGCGHTPGAAVDAEGCGDGLVCQNPLGVAATCMCPGTSQPPACSMVGAACTDFPGTTCQMIPVVNTMGCLKTCTMAGGSGGTMGTGGSGGGSCPGTQACGNFGGMNVCTEGGFPPPCDANMQCAGGGFCAMGFCIAPC